MMVVSSVGLVIMIVWIWNLANLKLTYYTTFTSNFRFTAILLTFLQSNLFNICKHWKSFDPHCMASKVWTLSAGIQLSSSSVPSYPSQHTKYCSLHFYYRSILESSISNISNSSSLSISTRDSGSWVWLDIILDMLGSSMEMWKTGWTAQNVLGSFFSV